MNSLEWSGVAFAFSLPLPFVRRRSVVANIQPAGSPPEPPSGKVAGHQFCLLLLLSLNAKDLPLVALQPPKLSPTSVHLQPSTFVFTPIGLDRFER